MADNLVKLASGRDPTEAALYMGHCTECSVVLDYPGLKLPLGAPTIERTRPPGIDSNSGYMTKYALFCHTCVREIVSVDGAFEQQLVDGSLDPEYIWIAKNNEDGEKTLQIGANTEENRELMYRGPGTDEPDA